MDFLNIIRHDCGPRFDANETAAYARELEYVFAEIVKAQYPDLRGRNMVPIVTGAPLGATSFRYFEVDGFGSAKFLDNMATEDFPTADIRGTEVTGKIRSIGAKWMVTVEELRASALMRNHPETEKPMLARRAIEELFDRTIVGATATLNGGYKGLAHDDSTTAWTGTPDNWFTESGVSGDPIKIFNNLKGMTEEAYLLTKSLYSQFDIFMPPEIGVLLNNPMRDLADRDLGMSIMQYCLKNLPYVRSISTDNYRLSGAGTTGKHRVLCYPKDPRVVDCFIPLEFEQFAPEFSGMTFVTHCHAKFGGLRIKQPVAMRRMDLATS